jgi:hypothetical protein
MLRLPLVLVLLVSVAGCHASSKGSTELSAAGLTEDYEKSRAEVRRKYDGKEIVVTGHASTTAALPKPGEDQGSVFLTESNSGGQRVTCWFSRDQAVEFSKVVPGQFVTVKGVFSGEAGLALRFCKLMEVE